MKIVVVGTGYVGLVSGTCFAETGIRVECVDIDEKKVGQLKQGHIPIYEPGLEQIFKRNTEKGRLAFSTDLKTAMKGAEAIFIAVGTPPGEDGSADLRHVLNVAAGIGKHLEQYTVVVTKSTVPVGTSYKVHGIIMQELGRRGVKVPFDVASNPEFLKEGDAVSDFLKPDRIIVGVDSEKAKKTIKKLYNAFVLNGHPVLFMDILSSEMTKYAANSMLATKISFMNDIANLCEIVGADVGMVRKGIGSDPRIGNKFIYPGIGYGGSCFPKDVKALIQIADQNGHSLDILKAVEAVNERQKSVLVAKIMAHFNGDIKGLRFAVWGLSFKPKTDDMREAPSLVIINRLIEHGAEITAYDPVAMEESKKILGSKISYARDEYDACVDAHGLILITEWPEFRVPNLRVLEKLMKNRLIFDGRNIYDPEEMEENNFTYYSIGRKTIK
ncbi:UDP-glucose 6-dehydrogenase [hydrothermal vent metagenome]|uniref:UDP-glucose 6-dehydrogenase n=1 Tax=hydrothermal vent metagenome TaxID=652676 RepID=A0A3B0UGC1_9ZZZZ